MVLIGMLMLRFKVGICDMKTRTTTKREEVELAIVVISDVMQQPGRGAGMILTLLAVTTLATVAMVSGEQQWRRMVAIG